MMNMVTMTTHTRSTLENDSTGHGYQTHDEGHPKQHLLFSWVGDILLEKCCVYILCCWYDLILQLLQVPLVCYGKDKVVPVLLTEHHAMEVYWGVKYSSTLSLTLALDGGEQSASHSSHFIPRERDPGIHWTGGWVGPRDILVCYGAFH
jgi:hypothetical protein